MLSVKDKSNYLRGLLIIIRLDQVITQYEKNSLMRIAKILGFDPEFCSEAVEELFNNPYISYIPPHFSHKEIGKAFLYDGLKLAYSDGNFHSNEISWIKNTAKINGIDKNYWRSRMNEYKAAKNMSSLNYNFDVERLLNQLKES